MTRHRFLTGLALALAAIPIGAWRLQRSDSGAAELPAGKRVVIEGTVGIGPRRFGDGSLFAVETAAGRVAVRAGPAMTPVDTGDRVRVAGRVAPAGDWIAGYLRRLGTRSWVEAARITSLGPGRHGPVGALDAVRSRAAAAIDGSMPPAEAALMRGFVLGDDSAISISTAGDFKRSGLAHLLAVSGQNVMLLLVLASAVLAVLGVPRSWRWPALAAIVAVYVPVAGASPSIQRAGIMGLVGLLAAWLERPLDRWWTLYVAAVATLAWSPLSIADAGWQLSFAAVAGIALASRPLASALRDRFGAQPGGAGSALADGVAITAAATVATAPLLAHHFGSVSVAALPANLLALPAVAPAMWSGMVLGVAGQVPGLPLDALGWAAGLLAGYVEWVAHAFGQPGWALAEVELDSWWMVAAAYVLIASAAILGRGIAGRAAPICAHRPAPGAVRHLPRRLAVALVVVVAPVAVVVVGDGPRSPDPSGVQRRWAFETRFLDVGQGDAILLRERAGPAVLVDTGYAGTGAQVRLRELGIDHLDALVLTHADADHAGNLEAIAGSMPVDLAITNGRDRRLTARIRRLGLRTTVVAAGDRLRFGPIRLDVIWPPLGRPDPGGEPNDAAIVAIAGWRGFTMLLTADAEAESTSYPATDVDVLKLPHHGSADLGLPGLLTDAAPELAVVSVGSDNTYGHPTESSLGAVAAAGVPLLRTDESGEVRIAADRRAWAVAPDP